MQLPIEDHGVIGDLRTVALVGLDGAIDYLCWPDLDSPSVFASLLHEADGGRFELAPDLPGVRTRQMYLPDTNVLLTRFRSEHGMVEISDFMTLPASGLPQRLVRRVKVLRGEVTIRLRCAPRFDYARAEHDCHLSDDRRTVEFESAPIEGRRRRLRLVAETALSVDGFQAQATFTLAPGESVCVTLDDAEDAEPAAHAAVADAFKRTADGWREWSARSNYRGRWRREVGRSALALKLLTSHEHGSIAAAATFGLPETPGGERNWDYRYAWIRDAAFTVYGFIRVGHVDEARAFMHWLERLTFADCGDGTLQVMYRIDGSADLEESELEHFGGYRGATPVRIGNGAADQLQLDIYGELIDAIYLADKYGETISIGAWRNLTRLLEHVEDNWQRPDEGIWEVRNGRRELLFSKLMCWVALDRGLRLADKRSLPAPVERWRDTRDRIHEDIHARFWNERRGAFVQEVGGERLDASCLLMPLVRFIGSTDPRWISTLRAIGEELTDDSLVYRYSTDPEHDDADGLDGIEGTFNMCSFWYIECLARAGDVQQARFLFEKMLGYANHVGLFAEETGTAGQQLGNFPQAFTHLALISAAHCLDRLL